MKKREYKGQERQRHYYFFDYLFWLGEMAQRHYKGEPRRPDGESMLMFCIMTFIYAPIFITTGHFLYGSPAFEWFTVAVIVGVLVIPHCVGRGWIYPFSRREAVMQHYEGRRFSPSRCYFFLFSLVFLLIAEMYLLPSALMRITEDRALVPFRYQGQYEDVETGLYYNRFRYYSPEMGMYISSDPIGLAGNNPTLYGYVQDVNIWLDPWGLIKNYYNGPKPKYENPGHHDPTNPNFRGGGNNKTSIIPTNAETIYEYAIPDKEGKHWYAIDESGEVHRFGNSNNGKVHWNGSSKQGRGIVVPKEVQLRFNNRNTHRKAPKATYCK